jgi:hypothetical protein
MDMRDMRTSKLRWALVAAVALGLASQTGAATTDNLEHLTITGGSLTIGDKTFSNFNFLPSLGLTSFDPSQIRVTASLAGGTYFLTWAGNISLVSGGPATADLMLNYRVTAATGMIDMIDQEFTGSVQPTGGGAFLAIDETVRDINGKRVANSHLDANDMSDTPAEAGDNLNLNPAQQIIDVTKDIAFGIVNGGFVSVSEIRQSFHQVPEAGTTPMLVVGLGILGFVVRQKIRPKLPL